MRKMITPHLLGQKSLLDGLLVVGQLLYFSYEHNQFLWPRKIAI